jgi:hypothetical protein
LHRLGIAFEDLTWEQAIANKYLNLAVIGVSNDAAGAAELMDVVYKTGNPVTKAGVHRFSPPLRVFAFIAMISTRSTQ